MYKYGIEYGIEILKDVALAYTSICDIKKLFKKKATSHEHKHVFQW